VSGKAVADLEPWRVAKARDVAGGAAAGPGRCGGRPSSSQALKGFDGVLLLPAQRVPARAGPGRRPQCRSRGSPLGL